MIIAGSEFVSIRLTIASSWPMEASQSGPARAPELESGQHSGHTVDLEYCLAVDVEFLGKKMRLDRSTVTVP